MTYLAIDVGGTYTKYALITAECEILSKGKVPTVMDSVEQVLDMLAGIYEPYQGQVAGIALSMPGVIDSDRGFMYTGGALTCIGNLNIVELLEARCGIPVTVENDAKCAGLAELWMGALKGCRDAIVIVCGTGIGGAIIQDGKLLKGKHFSAGEFSFLLTDPNQTESMNHSFGTRNGIHTLLADASKRLGIPKSELDGERLFAMANDGDEQAVAAIRAFAKGIAVQINNLQYITDPERFAIGGGISVQPLFIELLQEEITKLNEMYPWDLAMPEITTCRFFNDANLVGAVYVHINQMASK